jgi:MFS family permease
MVATMARAAPPAKPGPRARLAIAAVFITHAMLTAAWAPRIPAVKDHLGLDNGQLGLALAGGPVASVVMVLVAGKLVKRFGSRRVLGWLLPAFCLTAAAPGLATSQVTLFAALVVWGGLGGAVGVAMNAQAAQVESVTGRPIMARLHGLWSMGAFLGAGIATLCGAFSVQVALQAGLLGLAALAVVGGPLRWLSESPVSAPEVRPGRFRPGPVLVLLGILAFCSLFCEGTAESWSATFLAESARVPIGLAGIGYSAYALSMCCGRLVADRLVTRFGPARTVRVLVLVAAAGFGSALAMPAPLSAVLGLMALGLGFSPVIPLVYRSSTRVPGTSPGPALAGVSSAGWIGLVCAPPLIGTLAQISTLPAALSLIVAFAVVIAVAAGVTRFGSTANLTTKPDPH